MNPYGQRLNAKQKQRTVNRLSALAALFLWLLPSVVEPAEGQAKIQGAVFISPSGKLEGDLVMRGAGVEVMKTATPKGQHRLPNRGFDRRASPNFLDAIVEPRLD